MNGIFNNNFLMGFLLAKDLPRNEALTVGLAAGQSRTFLGPLLMQPTLVARKDFEDKNTTLQTSIQTIQGELATNQTKLADAQKELDVLGRQMTIEVGKLSTAGVPVTLKIPTGSPVNWRLDSPITGVDLKPDGALTIKPGSTGTTSISVDDGGFTRKLTLTLT